MDSHNVLEKAGADAALEAADFVAVEDLANLRVGLDHFLDRFVAHVIMQFHAGYSFQKIALTVQQSDSIANDLGQAGQTTLSFWTLRHTTTIMIDLSGLNILPA
jgi:hypothetical protein